MAEDKNKQKSAEELFGGAESDVSTADVETEASEEGEGIEGGVDGEQAKAEKETETEAEQETRAPGPETESTAEKSEEHPDDDEGENADVVDIKQESKKRELRDSIARKVSRDRVFEAIKQAFIKEIKPDLVDNKDVFNRLSVNERKEAKSKFGKKATRTAHEIRDMIRDGSLTYKKAFLKIDDWLSDIKDKDSEVSEFYLLQESKKLTDDVRDIFESQQGVAEDHPENKIAA
jgi:hypothetical protein